MLLYQIAIPPRCFVRCPANCPRGKLPLGQGEGLVQNQSQNQGWRAIFVGGNVPRTLCTNYKIKIIIQTETKIPLTLNQMLIPKGGKSHRVAVQQVCARSLGAQLGGQRLALGNQRFPVRVRLPAMCRGELPAAIARLMSKCL